MTFLQVSAIAIIVLISQNLYAQSLQFSNDNIQLSFSIEENGTPAYSLLRQNNKVINRSSMGFTIAGTGELKKMRSGQLDKTNDHFFIKCDNQIEKVFYNDLLYAEAMLNYVMLYTNSKKMMVYVTIKSLEEQLPASVFLKVHKSFIVNINKIKSIEGNILDIGNEKITISQSLQQKVISEIVKDKMIKR